MGTRRRDCPRRLGAAVAHRAGLPGRAADSIGSASGTTGRPFDGAPRSGHRVPGHPIRCQYRKKRVDTGELFGALSVRRRAPSRTAAWRQQLRYRERWRRREGITNEPGTVRRKNRERRGRNRGMGTTGAGRESPYFRAMTVPPAPTASGVGPSTTAFRLAPVGVASWAHFPPSRRNTAPPPPTV